MPPTAFLRAARRSYVFLTSQHCRDLERHFALKAALLTVRVNATAFVPRNTGNLCPDCDARFVFPIRVLFYIATRLSCPKTELRHSDEGFRS